MNPKKSRTSVRKERDDTLRDRVPMEMLEPTRQPMPAWMMDATLLPKKPPGVRR